MTNNSEQPALRQKVGLILGVALFIIALVAPTPEGMEPMAQRTAAVVLLMAVWWMSEAVEIAITSLLPLALFPILGILPSSVVAPLYTDQVIFLYFGGFVVALAIQKWNLHRRIALQTIRRVGVKPTRLVLGFMIATAFLSMWMSNTACAMMMLPIGMAVVVQLANEPGADEQGILKNFGSVLMLGIAYSASMGGIATLIGTPTNLVFSGASTRLVPGAPEVGFLQWMLVGVPLVVIFLPVGWWYLCRFSGDVPLVELRVEGGGEVIDQEIRKLGRMSKQERAVLAVWVVMAFLWIFRRPINLGMFETPGWSELFANPGYLHDATVAMSMALLLCLIPSRAGKREGDVDVEGASKFLMDWKTIRYGVPWGILFLFGGGFALAAGMEQSGLSQWLGNQFGSLAGMPPFLIVLLTCGAVSFLSEVSSNTATAIMALPILAATSGQIGQHPYLLMIAGTMAASYGFMLPVATPPNAIVYSSGWVPIPQMAKTGLALDLFGVLLVSVMVYMLAGPVFGIVIAQ